jgi:hypothetical protein
LPLRSVKIILLAKGVFMKKFFIIIGFLLSTMGISQELYPYGAYIQNKKTQERIIAHCHWLWDDKTQGKLLCLDLRLHLVDKHFYEIRELTKIKSQDIPRSPYLPGTDEYVRTPEDFKVIMVKKMLKQDFAGSKIEQQKTKLENFYKSLPMKNDDENFNIHKYFFSYLVSLPAVVVLYPYGIALNVADSLHHKVFYPAKVKNKSLKFYNALNKTITRKKDQKIKFKNSDFTFALDVLER